jgi:HTH-type transcriptional regulator, sugar sensing transcriptional regulator
LEPSFSEQQVLVDLGLTLKQARVYLALARFGISRTLELSKTSNVARPDLYDALEKLQNIGLVEKIIKKPVEYRAAPLSEGLFLLLKTKEDQFEKIRAETEILRETVRLDEAKNKNQTENSQFVLIPAGRAVLDKIAASIENAQCTIELVVSWKRFSRGITSSFAESIEKAWAKNVKIRFIVEKPQKGETSMQLVEFFKAKPSSQIRFIQAHPNTIFGIYDKKHVYVIVATRSDLQNSPALWSNNDALISLASDLFETLWLTSKENLN